MDIKTAVQEFEKISNKTGIMEEKIIMEPTYDDAIEMIQAFIDDLPRKLK